MILIVSGLSSLHVQLFVREINLVIYIYVAYQGRKNV